MESETVHAPLLILLNGAPASGKSTTAQRWAAARPLALALDVDVIRSMLGDWASAPAEAGLAARRLAVQMARSHLREGRDVIVPQFVGAPGLAFIEELASLSAEVGAVFVEAALSLPADAAARRFDERARAAEATGTGRLLHGALDDPMRRLLKKHEDFIQSRPGIIVVPSADGDPAETAHRLSRAIDRLVRDA